MQIRVFQESYDRATYDKNHPSGPKQDFRFRLGSQERALRAGIKLVGVGVLLGLNEQNQPWEHFGNDFEVMALIKHSFRLSHLSGSFPNTASLPRHQKSPGSDFETPNRVDDVRYVLYHAILRLFLPTTKLIVTNRETEEMRDILRPMINIEDLAARPGVGGNYREHTHMQNEIGDKRGPRELIEQLRGKGFTPLVP
jgi:2-iminoacetate synthase